jgi:hypothetical protein
MRKVAWCVGGILPRDFRYAPLPAQSLKLSPRPRPVRQRKSVRSGFTIGVSLGAGMLNIYEDEYGESGANTGFAGGLTLGGFVSPNVALVYDVVRTSIEKDYTGTRVQTVNTFAFKAYVSDQAWLKAGCGMAQLTSPDRSVHNYAGFGVMAGAGLELLHRRNVAMDVQLTTSVGFYTFEDEDDKSFSVGGGTLLVGVTWL